MTGCDRVRVQTGISDGTTTAIIGGDLREGARVVTGMSARRHHRRAHRAARR